MPWKNIIRMVRRAGCGMIIIALVAILVILIGLSFEEVCTLETVTAGSQSVPF